MAIKYHPKVGSILMCDFSQGFKEPEMTKKRPVLVVSSIRKRGGLVTVACISTSTPNPVEPYHYLLPKASMPRMKEFHRERKLGKSRYALHRRLSPVRSNQTTHQGSRW
ncbi:MULTISPECIES: type II toxin-antitoxin system PemK/MazF family toxin [unclassified Endozoicomonas]|uniref:type II toxin-antitoxin system PemK/MazF family toxin n=1 Tax=unclassified Endozoicomonas TaxID=2644528 RepID=UPI003BB65A5C